ncbi:MAG: replication factor C large subunit [Candidatus Hodarchaeales archaeon]|jgi:replication factor C large subunit
MLWTEKYRPSSKKNVVGNPSAMKTFSLWLKNWTPQKTKGKAVILRGPPGVGKTSMAHAFAKEEDLDLVEINASDWRSKKSIAGAFDMVKTRRLDGTAGKKIILMDEVDGLAPGQDRGGVGAMADLVDRSLVPIVFTDNGYVRGFQPLYKRCQIIQLKRIDKRTIIRILASIAQKEGIAIDENALRMLADNAEGDLRAAIGDLQACCFGLKEVAAGDVSQALSGRDITIEIFPMLKKIFASNSPFDSHASIGDLDIPIKYRSLLSWVYENAHLWATTHSELADMYQTIARADRYLGQIMQRQDWRLLKYLYVEATAGVNYAKKSPYEWKKAVFPYFATLRKEGREHTERLRKMGRALHCSTTKAAEYTVPFLPIIFQGQHPQMAAEIAISFDLADDEIKIFASRKARSVKKYMEKHRSNLGVLEKDIPDEWISSIQKISSPQKAKGTRQEEDMALPAKTSKAEDSKTTATAKKDAKKPKKPSTLDSFFN